MTSLPVLTLLLVFSQVGIQASEDDSDALAGCRQPTYHYSDKGTKETVTLDSCQGRCIVKCCPEKHILLIQEYISSDVVLTTNSSCVDSDKLKKEYNIKDDPNDYSKAKIDIFSNKDQNDPIKTEKKLSDFMFIFSESFKEDCSLNLIEYYSPKENTYYLLEDGRLRIYSPNELQPWSDFQRSQICVDYQVTLNLAGDVVSSVPHVNFRSLFTSDDSYNLEIYSAYGMAISSFFLALTLCVYIMLPDLRHLRGKLSMALMSTLLAMFLCKGVIHLAIIGRTTCSIFSKLSYVKCRSIILIYVLLSCFAWMNVMSYSMMRRFTSKTPAPRLTRREENSKFLRYSLFAFGVPLIEIVFIIIVDHLDLTHLPGFVKPHVFHNVSKHCFLGDDERRLYLNIPIIIALIANLYMFGRTVYAYLKDRKSIDKTMKKYSESQNQQDKNNTFLLFIKFSLIMGVMWVFEVISTEVAVGSAVWIAIDLYNVLSGLAIFILFVCTKPVLKKLSRKYQIFRPLARMCGIQVYTVDTSTETAVSSVRRTSRRQSSTSPSIRYT